MKYLLPWVALLCCVSVFAGSLRSTSVQQNTFGYIGQPSGEKVSLVALGGYRLYAPRIGHFLKQDSYSPFTGKRTLNGFNYAVGNPVLLVDASGHLPGAPVANGGSMPVVPPDGRGVVASGPPGVWSKGPPGVWSKGPPGVWSKGPPGVWSKGPPGVWSNAAVGKSFTPEQGISMPGEFKSPRVLLAEAVGFYNELLAAKTWQNIFRAETFARRQVLIAGLRDASIIWSSEKMGQQLEFLGKETENLGEWEGMIGEQNKLLGVQYSRIAKLYRAYHESMEAEAEAKAKAAYQKVTEVGKSWGYASPAEEDDAWFDVVMPVY